MKTYYELLQVSRDAPAAEIKQAFRRTIARYHPDKVQHLGAEFQELAQVRSAELTAAYKTLMDDERRAEYDRSLCGAVPWSQQAEAASAAPGVASPPPPAGHDANQAAPDRPDVLFDSLRSGRDTLLRRAALERLAHLFDQAFAVSERPEVPGFDLSCLSKPRLFERTRCRPWLLGKFVARVDRQAVQQVWVQAARLGAAKKAAVSVFLLSGDLAADGEVADAIAGHKRRANGDHPTVIIPVDVRDWRALIPEDADPAVRSLAVRLGSA